MRRLLLLRHAKSSWADLDQGDFDRPLTSRGIAACRALASHFAVTKVQPDLILCSAALRARATLAGLMPALAHDCQISIENRLYMATAPKLLERVQEIEDSVHCALMIGHNPGLERLAQLLAGSGPDDMREAMRVKFPTAALAVLDFAAAHWSAVDKDGGTLVRFVVPRDLGV